MLARLIQGPVVGRMVKSDETSLMIPPATRKHKKVKLNASENHCRQPAR